MKEVLGSLPEVITAYKNYNLLVPTATDVQLNPFYKFHVEEVPVDLGENSGDIFKVGSVKTGKQDEKGKDIWEDVFSLSKPLLNKMAMAAGIQFNPKETYGERIDRVTYRAQAQGAMRKADGTARTETDQKVICLEDEEEKYRIEFADKATKGITDEKQAQAAAEIFSGQWVETKNKWGKKCQAFVVAKEDRDRYIDRSVMVNMALLKKTWAEKAMTGAKLRVIRALLGVKGTYTKAELQKNFAIPTVIFSPDFSDPQVRQAMLTQGMTEKDAFAQNPMDDAGEIEKFVNGTAQCEFIQIHPSMEFDDIVYGLEVKASGGISLSYTEKRVMKLCNLARGKSDKYCVIFDDINRANASSLLGNLLYAMEYRNQDVELSNGSKMNIPENVIFIFTENTLDARNELDLAVRRRMSYLKELKADKEVIRSYYRPYISSSALNLVIDIYDRVEDYILSYFQAEPGIDPTQYIPGHGMYIVSRAGNVHFILDNIRQKIRFQIGPYLKDLYAMGFLKSSPDSFIEQVNLSVNVGVAGLCPITSITKKLVRQNTNITTFSLEDSRNYYFNTIVPAKCIDFRGMMECIIDALILNGVFPHLELYQTNISLIMGTDPEYQLLSYVLLTGADRCGFVLPGEKTEVKEMVSTGDNYLPLAPRILRYYELLLGSKSDSSELQKVLQ